jgi:hypothetical protein
MFYVPKTDHPSRPGWAQQRLFLTEGKEPLLVAHVTPCRKGATSVGCWAFAHPSDLEHLLDGIAKNKTPYDMRGLSVLLHSDTGIASITSEEVIDVTTNANDAAQRAFLVRTFQGNTYLLGDELVNEALLDVVIYQSSKPANILPGAQN